MNTEIYYEIINKVVYQSLILKQSEQPQIKEKEIFFKFDNCLLYFDNSMFYLEEDESPYNYYPNCYKYKFFLKHYLQLDNSILEFIPDNIESISRRIRKYMKYNNCNSMSICDIVEYLKNDVAVYIYKHCLHNKILKAYPIIKFGREFGNNKTKTFDFINITFSIASFNKSSSDVIKWINENKNHIYKIILLSIKYQLKYEYSIPLNYIKVDNCVLTKDFRLIYTLSLKDI